MGSAFNSQILVEKLAKLNSSQASIETLSHWCIFHMNKAKQVVETWARQFHSAPREQRLVFLYLANDILQNSRRKGPEFVGEFWKVLPEALRDVIHNGDDSGRQSAMRLINIWDERKVFGSRGQLLKEEFQGRQMENTKKNGNDLALKMKPSAGNTAEKIVLGYQMVNAAQIDEDVVSGKCQNAIGFLEKVEKEIGSHSNSEKLHDPAFTEELRSQNGILSTCIEQLTTIESSRTRLVSQLRESLQEQELKLDQVRNLLQAARSRSERTKKLCDPPPVINGSNNIQMMSNQTSKDTTPPIYIPLESIKEQSAPLMYTNSSAGCGIQTSDQDDPRKSAAAAMAAKLTASSSSAQMLSYVLSSLAFGNQDSSHPPPQKRPKLETDLSLPTSPPQQPPQSTMASFSMPMPLPPLPLLQSPAGQFNYIPQVVLQPPPEYSPVGVSGSLPAFTAPPAENSFQGFSGSEGSFYGHQPSIPTAPVSRQ